MHLRRYVCDSALRCHIDTLFIRFEQALCNAPPVFFQRAGRTHLPETEAEVCGVVMVIPWSPVRQINGIALKPPPQVTGLC